MAQGPLIFWQKPASLLFSTPALHPISVRQRSCQRLSERFLSAKRSAVSSRREEVAGAAALRRSSNKRAAALLNSWGFPTFSSSETLRLLRALSALSFWPAFAYRYGRLSTIFLPSGKPSVFGRHKALLLCKSPCEGAALGNGRLPRTTAPPSEEKFPEEICSSPVQD